MLTRRLTFLFVTLMAAGSIVGILVPAGLGWDFANFYDAGRRIAAGQITDLYAPASSIAGGAPQGTTGFFGTPLSAVFYVPMSGLSPEAALVWFKIQNVAAFAATFVLLFAFYRRLAPPGERARWEFAALFTGACLIFQPFWTVFRVGGQTTPTVLLLLTVAMIGHTRGRFWVSAIGVVAATLIKPAFAPALLFLLCVSGLAFLRAVAVVLVVTGSISLAWLGWPVHVDFLELVLKSGQLTYAWYYNSSLFIAIENIRTGLGLQADAYRPLFSGLTIAMQAFVLVTVVYLARKAHQAGWKRAALRHFDVIMATLFFLVWSRTVWEHYLSVLFLLLAYLVAVRQRFSRAALSLVAAIFALSVFQNLIFTSWLRAHVAFDTLPALLGIALVKSGPLLLTLVFLWRHWREWFDSYAAWPAENDAGVPASARRGVGVPADRSSATL